MKGALPKRPSGSTPEALFMQWVWDELNCNRINDVSGGRISRTTRGTNVYFKGGIGGKGLEVAWLQFDSMAGDYIVCLSGESVINVAKPPLLRFSTTSETVDNVLLTYDQYDTFNQTRRSYDGTNYQTEIITPRYSVGNLILAAKTTDVYSDGFSLEGVVWQDLNIDGRAWAGPVT